MWHPCCDHTTLGLMRWVNPELFHITLNFLGEVADDKLPNILTLLEKTRRLSPPFSIKLNRTGVFPSWRAPRVLWFGVDRQGERQLQEIATGLGNSQLTPHLTVGRVKGALNESQVAAWKNQPVDLPPIGVNKVLLIKSELTRQGPHYRILAEESLKGGN